MYYIWLSKKRVCVRQATADIGARSKRSIDLERLYLADQNT
jgi:hypothetical protein